MKIGVLPFILFGLGHRAVASTFIATFIFPGNQPETAIMDTEYNPVLHPATGELVTVGIPYNMKWKRTNGESINFKLFTAQSETKFTYTGFEFQILDPNQDEYEWNLNPEIASGDKYVLRLNNDAISPTFAISNSADGPLKSATSEISPEPSSPSTSGSTPTTSLTTQTTSFVTSMTRQTTQPSTSSSASTSEDASSESSTASTSAITSMTGGVTSSETPGTSESTSTSGASEPAKTGNTSPSSAEGQGGLSQDSKIGLGVGITFGLVTTIGVVYTYLTYKKK